MADALDAAIDAAVRRGLDRLVQRDREDHDAAFAEIQRRGTRWAADELVSLRALVRKGTPSVPAPVPSSEDIRQALALALQALDLSASDPIAAPFRIAGHATAISEIRRVLKAMD